MKTIETFLPIFKGFYGSILEYDNEELDLENILEDTGIEYSYEDISWGYEDYHNRIAEKCCEIIERELQYYYPSIKIKFQKLVSPKFYNYTNDSINVEIQISEEDFKNIILYLGVTNILEFEDYLKDRYTSRSGFISSYSNNIDIWLNKYLDFDSDKINHCFGAVLDFILTNQGIEEMDLYYNLDGENYINYELPD